MSTLGSAAFAGLKDTANSAAPALETAVRSSPNFQTKSTYHSIGGLILRHNSIAHAIQQQAAFAELEDTANRAAVALETAVRTSPNFQTNSTYNSIGELFLRYNTIADAMQQQQAKVEKARETFNLSIEGTDECEQAAVRWCEETTNARDGFLGSCAALAAEWEAIGSSEALNTDVDLDQKAKAMCLAVAAVCSQWHRDPNDRHL